jgi:hypothetical protein
MTEFYKPRWWCFALAVILIVAVSGVRTLDYDVPTYLSELARTGSAVVSPDRVFLLEGLLPDLIGTLLTFAPTYGVPPNDVSWGLGLCFACAATWFSIWNGSIGVWPAFLAVSFTRIVDTVFLFIGKSDPFLIAFLVLAVNRNVWVANVAAGLAALCHPFMAVASIVGVNAVTFWLQRRINLVQLGVTVLCAAIDLAVARIWFPHGWSRADYFAYILPFLLRNGIQFGISGAIVGLVLPLAMVACIVPNAFDKIHSPSWPIKIQPRAWPILTWFLGVCFASAILLLDHTRVTALFLIAPFLVWLTRGPFANASPPIAVKILCVLFLSRMYIPHIDYYEVAIFKYAAFKPIVEPLLSRLHI